MKILGIYGSPRRGGNSDLLLDEALAEARSAGAEVSTVRASELKVSGCLACGKCAKTGECAVEDDMQEIYPQLDQASVVLLATPVFFYGMPAQLKALIDRAQARWSRRMLGSPKQRKRHASGSGYLIAVGATRGKRLFEGMELTARFFLDALDKDYRGGLFFRGVDEKGAIRNHPSALGEARDLGQRIATGDRTRSYSSLTNAR